MREKDCDFLGMNRPITRRDFLDGIGIAIGGALATGAMGQTTAPPSYPPAQEGLRGSHAGSFEVAHRLRDRQFFQTAGPVEETGENYDLVVIGGGISGLSAAYFFRKQAGPGARILIIDNHDDFGGHAKRNEFQVGDRTLISYGGTQSIESPSRYSPVAKGLLREIGIDVNRFYTAFNRKLYQSRNMGSGVYFDGQVFGQNRLITGMETRKWAEFFAKAPLSDAGRRDLIRLYTEKIDYLPGKTRREKIALLRKISYRDFLVQYAKAGEEALKFLQTGPQDEYAVGIDALSAMTCAEEPLTDFAIELYPGLNGMNLRGGNGGDDDGGDDDEEEPYIFHFPDGNASIARLLVRHLVPGAMPGSTMEDVVTARADYSRLDDAANAVRIRLNSTAVRSAHIGDPASAKTVAIDYVQQGKLRRVQGKACILACYNGMIPYLCPEIGAKQKEALSYGVKAPLVYTQVAIRNWRAFEKLGVHQVLCPSAFFSRVALDFPVSLGSYRFSAGPDEPVVVFMLHTPCSPGKPIREQYRAGRAQLLAMPFRTFEENVRTQLNGMLAAGGFDAARDIAGITVNRWAHGYAYSYESLWDPQSRESERPNVIGRQPFGRISIANSDAGARAYSDAAIDQASRAVNEVMARAR